MSLPMLIPMGIVRVTATNVTARGHAGLIIPNVPGPLLLAVVRVRVLLIVVRLVLILMVLAGMLRAVVILAVILHIPPGLTAGVFVSLAMVRAVV
jgi:hypothetical protein